MTDIFRKLYSKTLLFFIRRKFDLFTVGSGTKILSWRIKGHKSSRATIGNDCIINGYIAIEKENATLSIGDRCFIGKGLISIAEGIDIGNDVMISWGVTITDHNSHSLKFTERKNDIKDWHCRNKNWSAVKIKNVVIQDKAWIGFNATLLKGITIGEGAIIGAGSVVSNDVAPFTIVAGNPARVIRELGPDER